MKLSIVIPVLNSHEVLRRQMLHFEKMMFPSTWEIVIVDDQGDSARVGTLELEVRHCPGQTPGHVIFYHAPSRLAIVGDVLFQGSIGRTDFPRGDYDTLIPLHPRAALLPRR